MADPLEPGSDVLHAAEPAAVVPDMPHWTDPPTGQVPAILDRRTDEDNTETQWSAAGDTGPAWREHRHEWDDSSFDPSLLADDETRVGALEETPLEERRPWEFDDLTAASADEDKWEAEHDTGSAAESWWSEEAEASREHVAAEGPVLSPRLAVVAGHHRARSGRAGGGVDQLVAPASPARPGRLAASGSPGARTAPERGLLRNLG